MDERAIVQRHLTGPQYDIRGPCIIFGANRDFLVDAQQVAFLIWLAMFLNTVDVSARNDAHTAIFLVSVIHGIPRGDGLWRLQPPEGDILMPRDKLFFVVAFAIFAKEVGGQQQNIRANCSFNLV